MLKRKKRYRRAMIIFYVISSSTTVIGLIFIDEILVLMGAAGDIFPYAKDYFVIILIGNIFSTGFSSIMRVEGKNVYSMMMWILSIILNIVLDAVLFFALNLGVRGSAYATIISQIISFIMCMFFFCKLSIQKFTNLKIDRNIIKKITHFIYLLSEHYN